MTDILLKALQQRKSEKKILTISQFGDIINELDLNLKEIAIITKKSQCEKSTFGYVINFDDVLDCESHNSIMNEKYKEIFESKSFYSNKIYLNAFHYNRMNDNKDIVIFLDLNKHISNNDTASYYSIKIVNVDK